MTETSSCSEEELDLALKELKVYGGFPLVRQCCECKSYMDEASKIVASHRSKIDFMVTHTYCPPCEEKLNAEIDALAKDDRR